MYSMIVQGCMSIYLLIIIIICNLVHASKGDYSSCQCKAYTCTCSMIVCTMYLRVVFRVLPKSWHKGGRVRSTPA